MRPRNIAPCPKCGKPMDTNYGHDTCGRCRQAENKKRYRERWSFKEMSLRGERRYVDRPCNICRHPIGVVSVWYDPAWVRFCDRCRQGIVRDIEMAGKMTQSVGR